MPLTDGDDSGRIAPGTIRTPTSIDGRRTAAQRIRNQSSRLFASRRVIGTQGIKQVNKMKNSHAWTARQWLRPEVLKRLLHGR
jgi:hypothetical protein